MDFDINEMVQKAAIMTPGFIIAMVLHEVAHGWMAHKWGDDTALEEGRVTLNPIPHVDPLGTIALPLIIFAIGSPILFGYAKPVPINPNRFRKFHPALFWVAAAGPLMNLILATLSAYILVFIYRFVPGDFYLAEPLARMAQFSVTINLWLMVFNFIPLPPLDGSKMVQSFLKVEAREKYESIAQYSFYIILGLMFVGAFRYLAIPVQIFTNLIYSLVQFTTRIQF